MKSLKALISAIVPTMSPIPIFAQNPKEDTIRKLENPEREAVLRRDTTSLSLSYTFTIKLTRALYNG